MQTALRILHHLLFSHIYCRIKQKMIPSERSITSLFVLVAINVQLHSMFASSQSNQCDKKGEGRDDTNIRYWNMYEMRHQDEDITYNCKYKWISSQYTR